MRVLHVVPSFGFGGMEKIICAVIKSALAEHQHEILPLDGCATAIKWIPNSRFRVIPFRKSELRGSFFGSLFTTLRQCRPDLLMTYNWGATDAIWLGNLAGISKIVHHEHGFNVDESILTTRRRDMIRLILYRLTSRIIVVSHELEEMLLNRFRLSKARVKRIPNGIDTSYYSPNEHERQRTRKSLGYHSSDIVIGFSGRLDPVKNLDLLLDIFRFSKPHENQFRLLIVGEGPDRLRLEARCRSKDLHAYVRFVGQHSDVLQYLRAMDVFLLTSLREQMPLTVLEAMSVGMPVIATRVGELPFIIDNGSDGFLRNLSDPIDLFLHPLRSLMSQSLRKNLGEAAREKMIGRFGIQAMVQKYDEILQEYAPTIPPSPTKL